MTILPMLMLAAMPLVDAEKHAVTFDVISTDCGLDTDVEFLIAGPDSDHDYEAIFLSENSVQELAEAFDKAGFPRGEPSNYRTCRLWPVGDEIVFSPDIWTFVRDMRDERKAAALFTGGARGPDGVPEAATNMPQAVFALYDCAQSLFQFDDALMQSDTYGRFRPAVKIPKGEKRTITVRWNGAKLHEKIDLVLEPGALTNAIANLRQKCADGRELDVTPRFSPDMTVGEAQAVASALQMLDSHRVKLNGFADGQFYYHAFLPLEKWRDRTQRLTQPYEVHFGEDGKPSLTIVTEDWTSDPDAADPKLIISENVDFASLASASRIADSCLIFAPKATRLADVFAVRRLMPPQVVNYYVYGE